MKFSRSFSLRNVLALQYIIVAIIPLLTITAFFVFLLIPQISTKNLSAAQTPILVEKKLNEMAQWLQAWQGTLKTGATSKQDIETFSSSARFFDAVYRINKNGQILSTILRRQKEFSSDAPASPLPLFSQIILPAEHGGQIFWSDISISSSTKHRVIACIVPLGNEALVGEISMQSFSEMLKTMHLPVAVLILDKNNAILVSSSDMPLLKEETPLPASLLALKEAGLYELQWGNNQSMRGMQSPLSQTPWSAFTAQPDVSPAGNLRSFSSFFIASIIAGIILAILLSLYFSRTLSQRLLGYTRNIREVARGSYPQLSSHSKIREMASLEKNIQKMHLAIHEKEKGYNKALSHYMEIIKVIDQIVLELDHNLIITKVNDAASTIFGLEPEKCIGHSFLDFIPPADLDRIKKHMAMWIEERSDTFTVENELLDHNGMLHTVMWTVTSRWDEQENFTGFSAIGHEFSAWRTMQEKWKLSMLVYQKSAEAMVVMDENNRIISVNPAFEEITGFTSREVLGQDLSILGSPSHNPLFYKNIWNRLDVSDNWQGETWNMRQNGDAYAIRLTINTIRTPDAKTYRRVALFSDITEQKLTEKITWQHNYFDSLTGLPNRNFLKQELSKAKKANMPVALMLLDLDNFKHINETMGYVAGDVLLQEVSHRLQKCTPQADSVIRLGSDEFAILLREPTDPEKVEEIGKLILAQLSDPFFFNNTAIHTSASIGVTFYPDDATNTDHLLKNADQAMSAAKHAGKNTLLYFTQSMRERMKNRMQLIHDLQQALIRQQFEILYQPIVEITSGAIHKAEALIRWKHPVRGMINPVEFISIAEDTGMIASFGNWIFHEASRQSRQWREQFHPDFQISINISPIQFRNKGIELVNWMAHLHQLQLPGKGLVIEITEGVWLDANEHVKEQLSAFKNAGMEIALDDFGVGYSSFSCLQNFNFDYIKIDQSFIKNLSPNNDNYALCEAIIGMAHKLNLKVIAEGVETVRQRELLLDASCDFGQGYLYSTPLSAKEFENILENNIALLYPYIQADIA